MKRNLLFCVCILLTGLFMYSCGPDDMAIQGQVKQTLLLNYPQTSNTVTNGIVTLRGTVASEEAKTDAEKLAKDVEGVKSVVNNIEVVVPVAKPSADEVLNLAITKAIETTGVKDVTVVVKDEEVTLSGSVNKADQKKVLDVVKGVKTKKVTNNMK